MAFKPKNLSDHQPRPFVECAHTGCREEAICKVRAPTGWANLCTYHFAEQTKPAAKEYCEAHGLVTQKDCIAHIRKLLNTPRDYRAWMKKPKSTIAAIYADEYLASHVVREPGEDDDLGEALAERIAA